MKKKITFKQQSIPKEYGKTIKNIYFVIEGGNPKIMQEFNNLTHDEKALIKSLICKMATEEDFRSPKIKYTLHNYNFGEIRPFPHRFFFFQKCGDNIIFFDYCIKKKNSLPDNFYKKLNKKKEQYEDEFQKFYKSSG